MIVDYWSTHRGQRQKAHYVSSSRPKTVEEVHVCLTGSAAQWVYSKDKRSANYIESVPEPSSLAAIERYCGQDGQSSVRTRMGMRKYVELGEPSSLYIYSTVIVLRSLAGIDHAGFPLRFYGELVWPLSKRSTCGLNSLGERSGDSFASIASMRSIIALARICTLRVVA